MNNSPGTIFRKLRVWGWRGVFSYLHRRREAILNRKSILRAAQRHRHGPSLESGITFVAPLSLQYSNSKTVRDFAYALRAANIPFQTFDTNRTPEIPIEDYGPILTPLEEFNPRRFDHVVEMFQSPFPTGLVPHRARIAFWEGEDGLLEVFPYLAEPDPVIAMSDFNFNYFRRALPATTPVFKITYPLPLDVSGFDAPKLVRARFGIPPNSFAVFYNFDLGSWGRKNPEAAIRAFSKAFRNDSHTCLVFKLKWAERFKDRVTRLDVLARETGVRDRLVLVRDYLSRRELHGLTNACDVYFSPHRAEGFGIGIAEAMFLGKPVVATDWSATTEFVRPEHSLPVPYQKVPVRDGEYFTSMGFWAEIDVEAAAAELRRLRRNPALAANLGQKAHAFILSHFSSAVFRSDVKQFLRFRFP